MKKTNKSIRACELLKQNIKKQIKGVFVNALKCVEIRFGKDFDGYESIRGEILRAGNDAIRNLENLIDTKINAEIIQDVMTVRFQEGREGNDE